MSVRGSRQFAVGLTIIAFLIRLVAVIGLRHIHEFHGMQAGADAVEFNLLGLNIANGTGYAITPGVLTSFRAPGFPLLLAGLYTISYKNYLLVYLVQCLLGALTCVLTYFVARRLLPESQARVSGMLAALYFPSVYLSTLFLSEPLFSACLALGLLLFIQYLQSQSLVSLTTAALTLGFATLTRPFSLLLLPIFLGILVISTRITSRWSRCLAPLLIFGLGFLVPIAPWTVRNYRVHKKFVLVATNGGSTFYGGNNDRVLKEPHNMGGWVSTVSLPGRSLIEATPDEVSHDSLEWRFGLQWVREHVLETPILGALKIVRFCLPDLSSGNRGFLLLNALSYAPFLLLFIVASVMTVRTREYWTIEWCTLHLTMLAAVITALIFWGSPRFRDANFPVLMVYAAMAWGRVWRWPIFGARKSPA